MDGPGRMSEADRMSALYTHLTASQVARKYFAAEEGRPVVSADTVRSWMQTGQLRAIDVSERGKQSRFVTRDEWVEEFICRRLNDAA